MESMSIKPKDIHMTPKQMQKFWKFINGDNLDFYEEYVIHLSLEERKKFFEENPDFVSSFLVSHDRINLMSDPMYRGLLKKIKAYEGGKENGKHD